jgi:hypothetical protein
LAFGINLFLGAAVGVVAIVGTIAVFGMKLRQARAACSPNCVDVDRAIAYLGWYGTLHKFEIRSQRFASDFITANQKKLVNLKSDARQLLTAGDSAFKPTMSRSPRRYVS